MEADEIGCAQQIIERHRFGIQPAGHLRWRRRIVVKHAHLEPARTAGHSLADAPKADQTQGCIVHVASHEQGRSPRLPASGADIFHAFDEPAGRRHQQGKGEVGGGVGKHAGRVSDRDSVGGGCRHVDVIITDRHLADHPQAIAGGFDQMGVDPVGQEGHQTGCLLRLCQQSFIRRWGFLLPHFGIGHLVDHLQPLLRDDAGHEYAWSGHLSSPWSVKDDYRTCSRQSNFPDSATGSFRLSLPATYCG